MPEAGPAPWQAAIKRAADVAVAGVGLAVTAPVIAVAVAAATVDTRQCGVYVQRRIGRHGTPFPLLKIRTMRPAPEGATTVTVGGDARITRLGAVLRRYKIDELPQLINVLFGDMSIVGPRPDVSGFADRLTGRDRVMLRVRPGITGPAALAYRHEESLLVGVEDPERYNREVIWPEKVRINVDYVRNYRLRDDFRCLLQTARAILARAESEGTGTAEG